METLENIKECLKLNIISLCIIGLVIIIIIVIIIILMKRFMLPEDFVFIFTYLKDVPGIVCENEAVRYRERHS